MNFPTIPTLDDITKAESYNGKDVINELEKLRVGYPTLPVKPRLGIKHTSDEAIVYSADLKVYEKEIAEYNANKKEINEHNVKVGDLIREWIKEDTGLNDIPAQYRDKVYSFAYSHGHSGGHREIRNYLVDLVDIFN